MNENNTNEQSALAVITDDPKVCSDLRIDKDDMVTVAVACEEERLKNTCKVLTDRHSELIKQSSTAQAELLKQVGAVHKEVAKKVSKHPIAASLKALGFKNVRVTPDWKNEAEYRLNIQCGDDSYSTLTSDKLLKVTVPASIKQLHAEMTAISKECGSIATQLREARLKLADLSSVERKAKAKLTMQAMQQTEGGRRMLAAMQSVSSTSGLLIASK